MKVVLFCGGLGTRLKEYSETIPKPLVNIGQRPVIWHIMKYYSYFGHKDFVLCLGYRGDMIKKYFLDYKEWISNNFVMSNGGNSIDLFNSDIQDWKITFVDTGLNSNIGQRLLKIKDYIGDDEIFLANYSDGLSDLNLDEYIKIFKYARVTASFLSVKLQQSFHSIKIDNNGYIQNILPIQELDIWINGGFFIFNKKIFDYIKFGEELVEEPFQRLLVENKLITYKYAGFWKSMDTFKDKMEYDSMVGKGNTPWEIWKDL